MSTRSTFEQQKLSQGADSSDVLQVSLQLRTFVLSQPGQKSNCATKFVKTFILSNITDIQQYGERDQQLCKVLSSEKTKCTELTLSE